MLQPALENNISDHFKRWSEASEATIEPFKSDVQLELDKCAVTMVIISPSIYVTYKGTKIPTKSIKSQTKNKFINRHVLNNVTPINVTAKEQGDYKFSTNITLTYDK